MPYIAMQDTVYTPPLHGRAQRAAHLEKATGFVCVSVDAVLDTLWCISDEVVRLALHGAHAPHLEHEPVHGFRLTSSILQHALTVSESRTSRLRRRPERISVRTVRPPSRLSLLLEGDVPKMQTCLKVCNFGAIYSEDLNDMKFARGDSDSGIFRSWGLWSHLGPQHVLGVVVDRQIP